MPNFDGPLAAWMRSHQFTVSTGALDAAGLTRSQLRRLVQARVVERVVDGGYQFAGIELNELTRCAALCASRPFVVVAGPTAGRIWRIPGSFLDDTVHVIGPPGSQPCRQSWVKVYRTALIGPDEIVTRPDGIRLTCPPRTLIDLARFLDDEELAAAFEFALKKRMCTVATLRRLALRLDSPRRPWVRRFLSVLDGRHPGRPRESRWEQCVLDALVARGVSDIESQVWERVPGYGAARFDFAIPALRWVLEVDVHPAHRTTKGQSSDHRRDRGARRIGWETERVGEDELTCDFDRTMDDLVASITTRRTEVAALIAAGLWTPGGLR